ncbi:MAG: septum formation protein Maf [Clostridia bacterium]|nr:septum formation protein Maf [Clostridia bacterium]
MGRLILASSSPNRRQILERAGIEFDWMVSDADESAEELSPAELVTELSKRKLTAVLPRCAFDDIVVTADTVVSIDEEILGKPHDENEERRFLKLLSGRTHVVYTGVCIAYKEKRMSFYQTTDVHFYPLSEKEVEAYVQSGEWRGKAGGYGIQGPAALFVEGIEGDYNNIFGLPAAQLMREIRMLTEE